MVRGYPWSRALALQVSPGEVWAALVEEGELVALNVAREGVADAVGAVLLGRVVALRPDLPAALIDIGLDRPGFLDARDADKPRGIAGLTEGTAVIVEILKAARLDKAAGLRLLRADDPRQATCEAAARGATPPSRLDRAEPAIVTAAKALLPSDEILIDERGALAELKRSFPETAAAMRFHADATPLFESLGIAEQVEGALQPRVALPRGGALFIEATQAAAMIDVDGGAQGALAANLAAAHAVARQIRLRNLAGPIVIDFIGLRKRDERDKVTATLKEACERDALGAELLGWTKLGHFELVRARRAPALGEILFERGADGAWRKTALTLALDALRNIAREAAARPARSLTLAAHPDVVAALDRGAGLAAREWLEARLGRKLAVEADPRRAREMVDIRAS